MAETASLAHESIQQPFLTRASRPETSALAVFLFHLMTVKKSNLCLSADVTSTSKLLELAETVGDSICMLKTHADIVDDFGERTIQGLVEISRKKKFLIFEDRKFGDIGSTVQKQFTSGPLRIAQWASLVNAHIFPGPAIIKALKSAAHSAPLSFHESVKMEITGGEQQQAGDAEMASSGNGIVATSTIQSYTEPSSISETMNPARQADDMAKVAKNLGNIPLQKGLLLLAEMSSEGNMLTGAYTDKCIALAREHWDFVIGFIAQRSLNAEPGDNFISFTPGVSLPPAEASDAAGVTGDGLGQQYNSPRKVVLEQGSDVIIVGRGILKAEDPVKEAERYRREAWTAYEERIARARS